MNNPESTREGKCRRLSLVPSPLPPRWSDWHWGQDGGIVRYDLDAREVVEECGDRRVLEENLEILKEVRQDYLDSALKAKSKSRAKELMRGVRDKERQIAWVEAKLSEFGSDPDQSGGEPLRGGEASRHLSSSKMRRRRGEGNGSIHWRTITRNGKDYPQAYYHWREGTQKRSKYIPAALLGLVQEAEAAKRPVVEVLELLGVSKSPSKPSVLEDNSVSPSKKLVAEELSSSKKSPSKRRDRGEGSGCIYWRTLTKNGKDYQQAYYHWREDGKQRTRYIPKGLLDQVQEAESQKLPVADILFLLGGDEKCSSKSSDTSSTSPKDKKCSSKVSPPSKKRQQGYGAGYVECKPIKRSGKEYPQYWYHYEFWKDGDRLVKSCKYIPKGKLAEIERLNEEKAPVREILKRLGMV